MTRDISFVLNGNPVQVNVDEDRMLLWVLRSDLALTGTKFGCGEGLCGACTVIADGEAIRSCKVSAGEVAGKRIVTIEGLARDGRLHPVQESFLKHAALRCGYCTPGMILGACALLMRNPHPAPAEIARHMDDHLCRCGSHVRIIDAIVEAAAVMNGGDSQ
jgi:nicotinate dehydrogenase subunit A